MGPTSVAIYVVLSVVGTTAALVAGLSRGLARAGWHERERRSPVSAVGLLLVVWLVATALLAWLGAYHGGQGPLPVLPLAMLVPVVAGGLLIWRSDAAWRIIEAVPQQWLVGVQVFRIIGFVFVVLWAGGSLPGAFALPAGLGDLATGLLAPVVALAWARNPAGGAAAVRAWNILGMTDLAIAFVTGAATTPRLAPLLGIDPPGMPIDAFPLVLIPAFAVPVAAVLHIASLAKLRQAPGRAASASKTKVTA